MKKSINGFPSPLLPMGVKTGRDYALQYCRAFHNEHKEGGTSKYLGFGYNEENDFALYRRYAHGEQPTNIYKTLLAHQRNLNKGKQNKSNLNIQWEILKIAPKVFANLTGKILTKETEIDVSAIDPLSVSEQTNKKNQLLAYMQNKDAFDEMSRQTGANFSEINPIPQGMPQPESELDVEAYSKIFFKNKFAGEIEDIVRTVFDNNNFEQVKSEFVRDLCEVGIGVIKTSMDSQGNVRIRRCIPEEVITNSSRYPDYRDKQRIAEFIYVSIAELKQMWPNQPEQVYKNIAMQSNPDRFSKISDDEYVDHHNHGGAPYDDFRIKIMDTEWKSVDPCNVKIKRKEDGTRVFVDNKYWKRKDIDKYLEKNPTYDVQDKQIVNWYKAKWIVGTEFVFDYGLATNMIREKNNLAEAKSSYVIIRTDIMTKVLKPIFDAIQINWLKYQQQIAQSRPNGLSIEMSAFKNISIGGAQKLKPKEVLALYYETGTLLWRRTDWRGSGAQWRPVEELKNTDLNGAAAHFKFIIDMIDLLRYISGIPEGADATLPNPKAGKATTEMAMVSVEDTLKNMYHAYTSSLNLTAENTLTLTQDSVQYYGGAQFKEALGDDSVRFIKLTKAMSMRKFGITIEFGSDDEDRQFMAEILNQAIQQQQIDPQTIMILRKEKNPYRAVRILTQKQLENERKAAANQQAIAQQELQKNQQSAMAAAQAEIEKIKAQLEADKELKQFESELDTAKDDHLTNNKIIVLEKTAQLKLPEITMNNQTKEDVAMIGAEADMEVAKLRQKETPSKEGASDKSR